MAAGLGFKDFVTGEVLTAADVDGYLMQGVWVFASAAARDAAVTSPQEGNFAYLKDTNVTTYYTGSAWANLDTTGMTNPMTTTGDTIYSSSGSTPARLGIGSTGQVLTVAAGVPSWATPAGGSGLTLIDEVAFSTTSAVNCDNVFTSTYKNYKIMVVAKNVASNLAADASFRMRASASATTTGYNSQRLNAYSPTVSTSSNALGTDEWYGFGLSGNDRGNNGATIELYYPQLASYTSYNSNGFYANAGNGTTEIFNSSGMLANTTQYDGIGFIFDNNSTGAIFIYGYAKE